ncbi:unnamed protein product [Blepharisma stoltei]|uniref:Uncharacterized protein n=1 Tax=Blepharisma stoltei TaxID=1481888 RepID=A0AAU9K1L7_9CILI|nr:unnamed protein product [Blepharisma stoltei]
MATEFFDNSLATCTIYGLLMAVTLFITYMFQKHYFAYYRPEESSNLLESDPSHSDGNPKEIKTEPQTPVKRCCSPLSPIKTPISFKRKKTLKTPDVSANKPSIFNQRIPLVSINANTLEATARLNMELNQGLR